MEINSTESLLLRIEELENRLAESEQLIDAIKAGEVDAFAFRTNNKSEIFTLQSGDYAYRVLVENFSEGALNLSEDGLIVYTNNYFHKLLALPYEKVIGNSVFNFIHSSSTETFNRLFKRGLTGQSKGEINLCAGEKMIPVYISLTSLHPTLPTVGMIVTDLTEKKRNENELREKNRFIETIIESSHELIAVYDQDCTLITVNKATEKFLGETRKKLIGKKLTEIYPGAKGTKPESDLLRALKGEFIQNEVYLSKVNGRYIQNYINPLKDENGNIYAALTIAHDVTDMKKAEETIRKANKQLEDKNIELERSNTELASFTYVASHDLQEPLRKIQTFSNLLLEKEFEKLSEYAKSIFGRLEVAAKRMQILIDDLLAYSRTNTTERKFKKIKLSAIIEEVKRDLKEEIKGKNALVESDVSYEINVLEFQFRQLLHNLINNSLKFARPGQAPHIKITSEIVEGSKYGNDHRFIEQNYFHLAITDNGIGFEPIYNEKIFELFQRLHGRQEYKGTGIGLAIVKRIVENHNGIITAHGEVDKGAKFDIFIPVQTTETKLAF